MGCWVLWGLCFCWALGFGETLFMLGSGFCRGSVMWGLCFCWDLGFAEALFCGVFVFAGIWVLWRLCFVGSLFSWGSGFSGGGIRWASKCKSSTLTLAAMENGQHRDNVVEDEEDGQYEEVNEMNVAVVGDPVARNGGDDDLPEHEIRLNAIGFEAGVVARLRDPIATNLGTPANPIVVGDLPIHGFEFVEILLTCPPL